MRGRFIFDNKIILPNLIVDEGGQSFLKMICQGDVADVALGGNFYIGLCGEAAAANNQAVLATITDEIGVANGYAREAIARNSTGWPTVDLVNGRPRARSAQVTFTASGGDFDSPFTRAFLCNVASGTVGVLFAFSGRLPNAITLTDGNSHNVQYELYIHE